MHLTQTRYAQKACAEMRGKYEETVSQLCNPVLPVSGNDRQCGGRNRSSDGGAGAV